MMLSINTLQFIASIFILLTGGLILAVFYQGVDRSARFWFYSCLSLGLGWFCLSLRTITPDFIGYSMAFFLIMYSYFLSSTSISLLARKESNLEAWQIGFCGFFALASLILIMTNNGQWIVPVTSVGFMVAALYATQITAQVRKQFPGRFMAAMQYLFIATALFWMLRIVLSSTFQIYPHVDMVLTNWFSLLILLAASLFRNFTYLAIRLSQTYQHQIALAQTEVERSREDLQIAAVAFESQEAIMVTDPYRKILRVNQAFTKITGYLAEESVGHNPQALLDSDRNARAFYKRVYESLQEHGVWQGEIWNKRKNGEDCLLWMTITSVNGSNGLLTHFVANFTDLTELKKEQAQIEQLTYFDPLTQLPNRYQFLERLNQLIQARSKYCHAILFLDLDNFKILNNTFGREIGDLLLVQVAARLRESIKDEGLIACLGGDKFAVSLEHLSEESLPAVERVRMLAQEVQKALYIPFQLGAHPYKCTSSIGITLFRSHEESAEELLKQAQIAMYQSKATGRDCIHYFDAQMQKALMVRSQMEADLRIALEEHQFCLHYQVQVDDQHRITGVEALVRLNHPQRGLIYPNDFIGIAEETGLILPLGHWILEEACRQITKWSSNPLTNHMIIAVNVSARQFYADDFVAQVLSILEDTGANPSMLKIEPTESLLLNDLEGTITKMNALKEAGVRFSLDDFGTGYSSLSYLRRLPLNQLKIDKSFVQDLPDDEDACSIARTIIGLGQNLNLKIVAEGVETKAQLNFLSNHGCHFFQGYYFSHPLPIHDVEMLIRRDSGYLC